MGEYNIGVLIILSLDTTTRTGSAAVLRGGVVLAEHEGNGALTHGQRLPGELMRVLEDAGMPIERVDLFAVAAGPGSFTGLRVGIATIQGLAMARGRKVAAISALDALARAGMSAERPIGAWMDAQRGEVFAALYAPGGRDVLVAATAATAESVLAAWAASTDLAAVTFVGDGAVRYRDVIARVTGGDPHVLPPPPLAGLIGQIAADEPARAVLPHAVVPVYLRRPDAEVARARRAEREPPAVRDGD